ncbi:phosphatase PAP2 family protein [Scleromatobacter humisilvae]|uniref:Phosphatase PAP2 family protein n=1 Tax=Scleromatobacter humisilvae TaxID=2897159 RepID=A0A9X1YJL3_9BURK|nr:phosphatase PAP2 family protein [Scleromatobacter humisilvae]MCK9687524.1 phosphatase PAP2 family protein [Scleromatobacter humisilvae]
MTGGNEIHSLFWLAVTRLGEAQILLPAFLAGALWLALARPAGARGRLALGNPHAHDHPARLSALRWVTGIVVVAGITTISKVAFLGFGYGIAAIDFTGFSGHSMFACSILPVIGAIVAGRSGTVAGVVLAVLITYSRVNLGAHSWSEAITGMALGAAAAGWTLADYLAHPGAVRAPWWLPLLLLVWLALLPMHAPPSRTHSLVVAISLKLSGRPRPYTRFELLAGLIHPAWQKAQPTTAP